ncbi:hypothetical protein CROQUDRAFT_650309 [Cronartium quercuum f. sp. fusiforme G11]|uniref:Uncharacterized protein n=1 Tax=Cronartium quercuum f. sp. fusiforme G11 TaxID=708437 RepID=A0A9P6TH79_9BASI|nr:hypothetical protein CROQUDRAFT_650309 [Cronartium quercuum f. sp. fusiforme G11]
MGSFSDQVFQQLQLQPLPSSSSSSPAQPPCIYSDDGPVQMDRPSAAPTTPSRSALKPSHRSFRSHAGSSEAGSERSVRFNSNSTLPSSPSRPKAFIPLNLPPPPPTSRSVSRASFRSVSSIGSRLKLKISNLRPSGLRTQPASSTLTWAGLREEFELCLARHSIIERCLVDVCLEPEDPVLTRRWVDRVWRLADKLSPALPAALLYASADGLLPLLGPLRQALETLAELVPFKASRHHFPPLDAALSRASRFASLIEHVIETVGRVGLVRFELVGEAETWTGELRGRTGSGANWRGHIRRSR